MTSADDRSGPPGLRVVRHDGAAAFLRRAGSWLLADEAANNLALAIAAGAAEAPDRYDRPLYFATTEDGEGRVVGCAFRTPPFKLGLTAMSAESARLVCEDVAEVYAELPAVLGPVAPATAFAECWAARTGITPRPGMRQRIFRLERLVPPARPAPGEARLATRGDVDLLVAWIEAFQEETGVPGAPARASAERVLAAGGVFLWLDEGVPVSMAAHAGTSPGGVRIGYVYTPPGLRGRGYATSLTAAASRPVLESGRVCFLYTDLANPTSNAIYRRLGYAPVMDVVDVLLSERNPG